MSRNWLHHKQWKDSIVRVNKDKSMLFGKTNKIDDLLVSYIRKKDSVQFNRLVVSDSSPCPSPTPRVCTNSGPSDWWCHWAISASVIPFSTWLWSFPASGSFTVNQFFISGGQSFGVSASISVLPMNIWDWFPLGWTGLISLQSKGHSRVFSNTTVQKHQFLGA